jgi:hypothetical protein
MNNSNPICQQGDHFSAIGELAVPQFRIPLDLADLYRAQGP